MFYVPIQKDFSEVKSKVAFGLTKRQVICFGAAAIVGIPSYLLMKRTLSNDIAGLLMIVIMIPFFLFAMYQKDGQPLEQLIKNITGEGRRPKIRPVVNEPLIEGVLQCAAWQEEEDMELQAAKEKSIIYQINKITTKGGGNKGGQKQKKQSYRTK